MKRVLLAVASITFASGAQAETFEGVRSSDANCSVEILESNGIKKIELDYESNLLDSYLTSPPTHDVYHNSLNIPAKVVDAISNKKVYSEISREDFPTVFSVTVDRNGKSVLKIQKQDRKAFARQHEWVLDTTIRFGAAAFSIEEVEQRAHKGPERADLNYDPFHIFTLYCTL